jgi:hypothetical protein
MKQLFSAAVILALLAAAFYFFLWDAVVLPLVPQWQVKRFENKLQQYAELQVSPVSGGPFDGTYDGQLRPAKKEMPYRKGKLFLLELRRTGQTDRWYPSVCDLWFGLPDALRATSPEETGTLLRVRPAIEEKTTLVYPSAERKEITVQKVAVEVIDLKEKLLVGRWLLVEQIPPEVLASKGKKEFLVHTEPLMKFIQALPAK